MDGYGSYYIDNKGRAHVLQADGVWYPAPDTSRPEPAVHYDVGPNDMLVIHISVYGVPANRVEAYVRRVKRDLMPALDQRGLKDRVLFCTHRDEDRKVRFEVIKIERPKNTPSHRYPPIMG